jgi:poly-D-alanine transfer protein DltD
LNNTLNYLGYKNVNEDITKIDDDLKILKYRYRKLKDLSHDIDELDSIGKEAGIKDSEFIKVIKKDLKKRIDIEKASIIRSSSRILSDLDNGKFN